MGGAGSFGLGLQSNLEVPRSHSDVDRSPFVVGPSSGSLASAGTCLGGIDPCPMRMCKSQRPSAPLSGASCAGRCRIGGAAAA
eukprot:3874648-Pyramimonas_sp.AAC.1